MQSTQMKAYFIEGCILVLFGNEFTFYAKKKNYVALRVEM